MQALADEEARGKHVAAPLFSALVEYGARQSWKALEGYPFDPVAVEKHGDDVLWPGRTESFAVAGFTRVGPHWIEHPEYPRSIWRREL